MNLALASLVGSSLFQTYLVTLQAPLFTIFTQAVMHLVYPPPPKKKKKKNSTTIVFDFSWDDCYTPEKLETMVMQNLGVGTRCIMVYVKMVNRGMDEGGSAKYD